MSKDYYVYIMSSRTGTLYTGVTGSLEERVAQHKTKATPGYTARYNVTGLVYCEHSVDINAAITREKQIKGWSRQKKLDLIKDANPTFRDLSEDW